MIELATIDWSRPWYASVRASAAHIAGRGDWREALAEQGARQALVNQQGKPIRFVDPGRMPQATDYETFIHATGCVPTRENLHDAFNALVWLGFARAKAQLNAIQAHEIAQRGIGHTRGPLRDAATVFDENGGLMVVRAGTDGEYVAEAIRQRDWSHALLARRETFARHIDIWLFGHALLEKLLAPYKSITAHILVIKASDEYFGLAAGQRRPWLDAYLSSHWQACPHEHLRMSHLMPLPVLGIPGWWQGQGREFYADARVFRTQGRIAQPS